MPDRYLSTKEAADYLGYSVGTIRNMVCKKSLPHYKCQGALKFKPEELDEGMQQFRVSTDAEIAERA